MPYRADFTEIPTTETFVPGVVDRTRCVTHRKEYGEFCHHVEGLMTRPIQGICNERALRAGINGPIRPQSLDRSLTRPKRG